MHITCTCILYGIRNKDSHAFRWKPVVIIIDSWVILNVNNSLAKIQFRLLKTEKVYKSIYRYSGFGYMPYIELYNYKDILSECWSMARAWMKFMIMKTENRCFSRSAMFSLKYHKLQTRGKSHRDDILRNVSKICRVESILYKY